MNRSPSGGVGGAGMGRSAPGEPVLAQLLVERGFADLESARQLGAREVGVAAERLLEPAPLRLLDERGQPGREVGRAAGGRRTARPVEQAEELARLDRS